MAVNKFGQDFGHSNREPGRIAKRMDSEARKENNLFERNQLQNRKADLELQRQDLINRRDAFILQSKSAKNLLKDLKKGDGDYESMRNAEKVATAKARDLEPVIAELGEKIDAVQADIDANLAGLKVAIDAEFGKAAHAEVRGMIERGAGDAMALVGELRAKLEAYENYQAGLTADAAAELERLTEGAEAIWRAVQKI